MSQRRPLIQGIKPATPAVDPLKEEQFVFGDKGKRVPEPPVETATQPVGRAPITTRIRADFAVALKRASLERQLNGIKPYTLQEFLEEALEPWLRDHGYIS